MITKLQVKTTVYGAFYRIVRSGQQLSLADFFSKTVDETWPKTPPPGDWPDFWWESVALEMQNGFMAYRAYLNNLDGAWLKAHHADTWQKVLDEVNDNIESLEDVL